MSDRGHDGEMDHPKHVKDKRRLMVTQLLRSPVMNPAGTEVGRVEDFIVKLADGAYPPVKGLKVRVGAQDVFIGRDLIDRLEPGAARLNTHTIRTEAFQRRPGEVLLAADVLGRHLVDMVKGRIVQAHDLVLAPSDDGWYLAGIDRSPQAMIRRLIPRRGRPDLRRHAILDWRSVQPFVGHVPTAKLLMPLQRLRRLHPAQIADIVEGASHDEGQEIIEAVESDPALTADIFEELDTEHQVEFLQSKSNEEAAKLLERMAPDDAADLLAAMDQDRRKPVFDLMSPNQQHKLRKLLQYRSGCLRRGGDCRGPAESRPHGGDRQPRADQLLDPRQRRFRGRHADDGRLQPDRPRRHRRGRQPDRGHLLR